MKRTHRHSSSPKRLTAIQTSRHLHVAHRRHTGKVLPRASTSYPMLLMIVMVTGVLIASWTRAVTADTPVGSPQIQNAYTVSASVPGPAPTIAASISSPQNGSHVNATPVTVNGSCPNDANGGYVSIYRNNFYSGTALCQANGSYQLSTDLFVGANQLVARIYSLTDVAGPDSALVTVYYDSPAPASNPAPAKSSPAGFSVNSTSPAAAVATPSLPLTLSTQFAIRGYYVGQSTSWQLDIAGGSAPYALAVDWGDGTTGIVSQGSDGLVHLTHTYQKPGAYRGSYVVKFTVTDAAGNQTYLQLLVVVNSRQQSPVIGSSGSGGSSFGSGVLHSLRNYIWPSYGLVVLMLASFWLGERREIQLLRPHHKHVRHA